MIRISRDFQTIFSSAVFIGQIDQHGTPVYREPVAQRN
jgi:hypothetical protein